MEDSEIKIPKGFKPFEDSAVSIPEGFSPAPESAPERGVDLANQAVNLGLAYQQGRYMGIPAKAMSAIGAGIAKPILEGVELVSDYEAPSYYDLYKTGVRGVQGRVEQAREDNPYLAPAAELAGAVRTGFQVGGSKYGKRVADWVKGTPKRGAPLAERAAALFSKTAKQSGLGAAGLAAYGQGVADPDAQGEGILSDLTMGGAFGGGLGLAGSALGAGLKAATPAVSEGLEGVVSLAKKHNIPVSLEQVTDSKVLKNVQKISQEMPFSGFDDFKNVQRGSFNSAVAKTFGENSEKITPEIMDKAFTRLGKDFDDLSKGKTYSAEVLKNNLDEYMQDAGEIYSKEAFEAAKKRINSIVSDLSPDNTISGDKLSFQRQKINAMARKANDFDKQSIFRDLENAIVETLTEGDDALKAGLKNTKQQYKNLLAVEPLAVKAKGGDISPTLLNNRVAKIYGRQHTRGKSGDLGEIARVGFELLGELGGSDTAQKMLYSAGAGAGVLGGQAIPVSGALAANRGFQKWFNQNQNLAEEALYKAYKKSLSSQGAKNIGKTAQELIEGQ